MDKYKISVIIPTFNLEYKIKQAFESVKNQTIGFENLEVIFVDDNSTDDTLNTLNELSQRHENVSVFKTEKNSGYAGKPRNIGLENAKAEYVLFLDGDDELLINSCEVLYDKVTSTDSDIVIGGQINVFDGIHQHNPPLLYGNERTFEDMKTTEVLDIGPAISAKLFNMKLIMDNEIRFPEGISGQDLVFFMKALLKSKKIITLNNFYVYYRILSDNSVTFNITETYLKGLIKAYTLVCELYEKFELPQNVQEKAIYQHIRFFTLQTLRANVESNKAWLDGLFNSDVFKNLSNKDVFKKNEYYKKYFENMNHGQYDNYSLLNNIANNFIQEDEDLKMTNEKLYEANLTLKNNYESLYESNKRWNEKFNETKDRLENEISKLKEESENEISRLKSELEDAKFNQGIIDDENIYLKNDNIKLYEKCDELQREIDDIKSSKMWKLTNKF